MEHNERTQLAVTAISRYLASKDKKYGEFVDDYVEKQLLRRNEKKLQHKETRIKAWIMRLLVPEANGKAK